jgi:cellulose synthase (UDP-forming)
LIDLFPGFVGYCLALAGFLMICPLLPWKHPLFRGIVAIIALYFNYRYIHWRYYETLPATAFTPEFIWAGLIFATEFIATIQSSFHLIMFTKLTNHTPVASSYEAKMRALDPVKDEDQFPSIDIFLPTYNESWKVLEPVVYAALHVDWPNCTVYMLDDGQRDWLRDRCKRYGINYIRRKERTGYKAGNINNGMRQTTGEFVLSIDVDFSVYPNILYRTLGLMADPRIAIVQTPANFQNPDPIQYNLLGEDAWPEEQRVFTDVLQPARDAWNNSFCYGSVFLARRSALEKIGGIPEDSITEDLYSSYALRGAGYLIRYLNEPVCQGLAAESLAEYLRQRCRWATGTMQCIYLPKGPFRGKGLSLLDRLFYLDPVLFYMSFLFPFLMLYAPAMYWWTGMPPFNATGGHLLSMLVPRMAVTIISLYWLSGRKVVPFVSDLGRTAAIHYYVPSMLRGLFDPFGHMYRVTLKGEIRDRHVVQWHPLRRLFFVLFLTLSGMILNLTKHGNIWLLWDPNMPQVLAFTVFNLWILFFGCLVCVERPADESTRYRPAATTGNIRKSIWALTRRVFA